MTIDSLVSQLRSLDIRLWKDGNRLRYDAPGGVLTPDLRAKLVEHKSEILAFLDEAQAAVAAPAPSIRPAPRGQGLPLSFAQQRLWFLDQLAPGESTYNIPAAVRLTGRLHVDALKQGLDAIVARHEILRTTFAADGEQPVQVIAPALAVPLPIVDLRTLSRTAQAALIQQLATEEAQRPFDLQTGPLLRARLLWAAQDHHVLLLTLHHIVSDGWSMETLLREMAAFYTALADGRSVSLPALPIQYADFAHWQREWLQGRVLEQALAYWKQQLADAPRVSTLPSDRPRPAVQTFHGAIVRFALPAGLSAALAALSRQEGATLFMTLFAAFNVLLYRHSGQADLVVGSPIANRSPADIEGLIGCFANTLALRTRLSPDLGFRELLERVRQTTLNAYAHQAAPFEMLVEAIQPERSLSHTPLFQVMFVFQNVPAAEIALPGLRLTPLPVESKTSKFDLMLSMVETSQGLRGSLEFNTDLFDDSTAARLTEHFQVLLQAVVTNPDRRVSDLPLLTERERHQLLLGWNETETAYDLEACLHHRFEAQVERSPAQVAVAFEGKSLTYDELNRRANRLAHYLRALGVGPEVCVGVCLERSLEMVVALYAVLKAGGAYVPLDPTYPAERLAYMLEDASVPVLLTQAHLVDGLPAHRARVVCLDRDWPLIAGCPAANLQLDLTPDNLAYVIYTSGSTGQPKGAMNTHRGICNRLLWMQAAYGLSPDDRVLQKTPFSFDVSVWEFFWPLQNGARLVVARPEGHKDSSYLVQLIQAEQITTLHFVPSMLQTFLEHPEVEGCRSLRQVMCSGEALPYELQERFFARLGAELHNLYGPTEAAVDVTAWACQRGSERAVVPIGRPIANIRMFVLDEHMQPAPTGVAGELYIAGVGLGRGYHGRAGLTAEKFIPNPYPQEGMGGSRLYKTGDLARWLPDGSIDFLGRLDHQVKVRGFRIELGEIEAVLRQHTAVLDTVVVAQSIDGWPGDKRLVAYLVPVDEAKPASSALRDYLKEKLPEYMVPSLFVWLPALPLTPSGKVDRRSLPAAEWARSETDEAYVAPRNPTEEILVNIWTQILPGERSGSAPPIGIHDNFFERGGHSLLATQAVSRIRQAFQVELSLRVLFETPTVSGLASHIEAARRSGQGPVFLPLRPVSRQGELPLSFAQQRLWFLDQLEPGTSSYNILTGVHLVGPLSLAGLVYSLNEVVRRHEVLRTTFPTSAGGPVQCIAPELTVEVPVVDLRHLPESERETQVRQRVEGEAQRPFDLAQGPLVRATVLKLADGEHVLLLTMHHIVSDGWSMTVFVRELASGYQASLVLPSLAGVHPAATALPELPIQYADYAAWQRQWLEQGSVLDTQLAYWKRQLADLPPGLDLPNDHPRPAVQTFHGARQSLTLSPSLSAALRALSRQRGVTLFMTLLAAFNTLLSRYTGQTDIVIGSPIANRNRAEIEGLIGFFINTLALRTRLEGVSGCPSFDEVLRRVREVTLDAYAYQDLPFEKLVEALHPERDLSRPPLFQVFFNMLNLPDDPIELPGLQVQFLRLPETDSKFDLTLHVQERDAGLHLSLAYNADLFEPATMVRLLRHFQVLLDGIVANPALRLWELPLLTEAERRQILGEWTGIEAAYPRGLCIHDLVNRQAAKSPDAVAVTFEDQHLTFRGLDQCANRLACELQARGVGPGVVVGLCAERSIEMVIGLLAVLKSGCAYVPLDPTYPSERLAFMLEDTQAQLLLVQPHLRAGLPDYTGPLLYLEAQPTRTDAPVDIQPRALAAAADLAYVVYTSGSTGRPKGILVPHRTVVNYLAYVTQTFQLNPEDAVLQLASLSFDASVRDIIGPLSVGARLVLVSSADVQDPVRLLSQIEDRRVTRILSIVPTLLRSLAQAGREVGASTASIQTVLVSGEALYFSDCQQARRVFGEQALVVNQYGPTECTMTSSFHPVAAASGGRGIVPIGRPIPNARFYILDSHLQPVPAGVRGEVYIGGRGVAWGYLNQPGLTAEKFVPDPFGQAAEGGAAEQGSRLYKTGDLARYLPDGTMDFLGRSDDQVKVRGQRVELGEIEARLNQHPRVRQAVVVAHGASGAGQVSGESAPPASPTLVAYLVPAEERPVSTQPPSLASQLRAFLREQLPDFMAPSAFVLLEALPRTPNGKVDRRALRLKGVPETAGRQLANAFEAPRTPAEEMLAAIWVDVLGLEQVGVHDNFFDLGGHSLLATLVVSRVRSMFEIELPLRRLFEAPTVAALAKCVEAAQQVEQQLPARPLLPAPRGGPLPLSYAQQRLWFLDQLEPGNPFYNISTALQLTGPLEVAVLEQCFNDLVRRHETLRTRFGEVEGRPFQVVAPASTLLLSLIDLRELDDRDRRVRRLAEQDALQPFDLARGPLVRATLLRLAPDQHVLLLSMHHIISDVWSLGVLTREIAALYQAYSQGQPSPLAALPIQYADFAAWQRRRLEDDGGLEQQLAYWKQQLDGAATVLELPADRPRPAVQSFRGARQPFGLAGPLSSKIKMLSRHEGSTPFMTLLAAFATLLYRYTGQPDILIGSPIANRNRSEIEGLIGFFVNTLVLRARLEGASGPQSFRQVLRGLKTMTLGAYAHQDLPFEVLVDRMQPERDLSHSPLFQVMFVFQNTPLADLSVANLSFSALAIEKHTAKFDLTLFVWETADGFEAALEYNTDLFEAETIGRMAEHFHGLLEGIVAAPDASVADLFFLTRAEQKLLVEWNVSQADESGSQCVQHRFEAQVDQRPDAVALVFEDHYLTYAELNRRSNRLAHYLRRRGLGPEVLVGICVERSLDMIVGVLGILKAGGAYVPVDPAFPLHRSAFMLQDARVPVLLTQARLAADSSGYPGHLVCLDADWETIEQECDDNPLSGVTAQNLVYVIYTSGSTGQPKGVALEHRQLLNYLNGIQAKLDVSAGTSFATVSTIAADLGNTMIFPALSSGGSLHVISTGRLSDAAAWEEYFESRRIDCLKIVPSHLAAMQSSGVSGQSLPARRLVLGGEASHWDEIKTLQALAPQLTILNHYGPTETCIGVLTYTLEAAPPSAAPASVPLGRPLANTQIHLLDKHFNRVPLGVPGELYVAGAGLARGYLDRPDLTAQAFLPDPFSAQPGARLYRTGDLARYLPDGNIEFLGRADHQVKIRGYRVELGEIEAVLMQHPEVRESVLMAREVAPGARQLVAYVVADLDRPSLADDLSRFLHGRLPDYMVPSAFVLLEALPLTPNGKVDRRALPAPDVSPPATENAWVMPDTPTEQALARIWKSVLRIEQVGVHDNFFRLGGHSLLATQVLARIRDAFQVRLTLHALFEAPTIAGLAERIDSARWTTENPQPSPSTVGGVYEEGEL